MRSFQTLILGLISVFLLPALAVAEGNIHIGQLKINPYVSATETFSDNIYYTPTDERHDSITTITPGVRMTLPFRIDQADLEYYSIFTRYNKYTEEDTTDYHASGAVDLHFGSLLGLKLSDQFDKSHEPRGWSSTGLIEIYRQNTAVASATYKLADLSKIQLDYSPTIWRFKTSDFRNRDEALVSAYFYYRFLPKTSAFIEYDHNTVVYSQKTLDLDSDADTVQVGLTWDISAKLKGTIKGGMTKKDFKSSAQRDYTGWTWSADVRHDLTARTSVMIMGQRSVNETGLLGGSYYVTTGAYTELRHWFVRKLSVVVRGSYGEDQYSNIISPETTARKNRATMEGAGLKYTIKDWLELALDYDIKERQSNIPAINYREHSTMVSANLSF